MVAREAIIASLNGRQNEMFSEAVCLETEGHLSRRQQYSESLRTRAWRRLQVGDGSSSFVDDGPPRAY